MSRISSENEGQRVVQIVTMNDKWYNKWQRVTMSGITSGATNDNEWQRVTANENEWQWTTTCGKNEWKRTKASKM